MCGKKIKNQGYSLELEKAVQMETDLSLNNK